MTPGSGEGRARGVARRLKRLLRRRGVPSVIRAFENLPSLSAWANESEPEYSALVCVGGDATQSAAAAFARRHGIPFLPVPNGFGNLFAGFFGHPSSPQRVLRLLDRGALRSVDVGVAGDELFLSHRSYGFLDDVQEQVEAGRKQPKARLARLAAYYWGAVHAIWNTQLTPLRVEVDGAVVAEDAVLVTVANVETYRGFLSLTPAASPIDGRFDVFVMPMTGKIGMAWRLFKLKLGLPGRWRGVSLYRGRRVSVSSRQHRETLTVARRALPLLVPADAIEGLERRQTEDEEVPIQTVA